MTKNSKALIGAIKAGQAWLKWDDETYRTTLIRITGKNSSTRCTLEELENMREYMHTQGYPRKSSRKYGRRPNVASSRKGVLAKIEALLADAKREWGYAEAVASRMFGQKVIEWLSNEQLTKLMQALVIDAKRRS